MKGKCAWSVCFLILVGFVSTNLFAQSQSSVRGELGGTVVDSSKAVVAGALVSLSGPTGNANTMSNEQGAFLFTALIPGFYGVKVEKTGFKSASVQDVEVQINKTAQLQVQLEVGTVTETVEVVAAAVAVEDTSTSVNADISDTVYKNLPLGRNIANVFYLSPGVVSGLGTGLENPGISGSTGLENAYVADGVLLNDAAFGGMGIYSRAYGSIGVGINQSFVQEVQVKTAGFEPQYGHATGGVVTMVTKSGGPAMHGVIGGYFQSRGMGALYANNDDFHPLNLVGRQLKKGTDEGDFELGGYVPLGKLKDHLFFFGAFNPTWNHSWVAPTTTSARFAATGGEIERSTRIWDYSAKLTWQLNTKHRIESSVFGDPSLTNSTAWAALNIDNNSADSILDYGGRSWATRYDGTLGADWIVSGNFAWNWNRFNETPTSNIFRIQDLTQTAGLPGQRGSFRAQGLGFFENYDSNTKSLAFDTSKGFTIGGHHTFSVGYYWQFPTYVDANGYSGPRYPIPLVNHDGTDDLSAAQKALVTGGQSDAYFRLQLAPSSCTLCPYMTVPGYGTARRVAAYQYRGIFSSGLSNNTSKYHAAYVNDSWQMGNHVTLNVGVRWEQERITASGVHHVLNDQWSPRVGFSVDPKGDRKSKIYANFGRYAWYMPLDAAIRELTAESDYRKVYFAPDSTTPASCPAGTVAPCPFVTINSLNTVTITPTAANLLNKAVGGINKGVVASTVIAGDPFEAGTRMEYSDEFVVGAEHEFRGGITVSARYIDRRLKRIIEDFGGVSIEQNNAGFGQFYAIGNPNANSDFVVNSNEIAFSKGVLFDPKSPTSAYPSGCVDANGNLAPTDLNELTTFGAAATTPQPADILGSACFPSVNMNPWTDSSGNVLAGALFGGEAGANCPLPAPACDGQPDGYSDPKREYQAVEFEINKAFSHNWSLLSNYRISRLRGNFEGAFRNDNGQSDPGISSLFDFTPGLLNTLGKQFAVGPLNSDALHVVNIYPSYTFDRGPKGLVVSPGIKVQSGVPLTTLTAQSAYLNPGEVPIFGRGDLGRLPATGTVDVHVEYPRRISEGKFLSIALDFLNIANSKRALSLAQFNDLSYGTINADFKKPGNSPPDNLVDQLTAGFVNPFSMRIGVQFKF